MITKIIHEDKIQKATRLVHKNDTIVITCHVSPDGDAIGSSLGLYHFLSALEKEVTIVVPDAFPSNLKCLPGTKEIVVFDKYPEFAAEIIQKANLIFCLDFNAIKRVGEPLSKELLLSDAPKILVDHHLDPESFCDVIISHPEISSTSELVFRLICRMGMFDVVDVPCASAIYAGMMTDTGNFTYNSNNPEIYYIVGELVKKGINKDRIYERIMNTNSADKLRLNGYAVGEKMKVYPQRAALITLTREELNRFHYVKGDTEGLVNVPLSISGIVFSAFFREEDGYVKISLRSKGKFPTNMVASAHFNGGGHLNASGGEFMGSLADAVALFEEILPLYTQYLED